MGLAKSGKPKYKPTEIKVWGGMNNLLDPRALGRTKERPDLLRNAVNVSFDDSGRPKIRTGRTQVYVGTDVRSLYEASPGFLFAEGTVIKQLDLDNYAATTVATGVDAKAPVSFVTVNDEHYWSDGVSTGKIGDTQWGIPLGPVPALTALAGGSMTAGRYHVAVTHLHGAEEGGAGRAWPVDVAEGGGIRVAGLPGTPVRIYVTSANGELPFLHTTTSAASVDLSVSSNQGMLLRGLGAHPFPACELLTHAFGRVFGALGNFLIFSMPLQYRLFRPQQDFASFASDLTLIAPVRDGLFVADGKATYWLPVGDTELFPTRPTVLNYPAVKGAIARVRDSEDEIAWFTPRGWVVGTSGGKVKNITESNVAIQDKITRGAGVLRELDGRRELISSLERNGVRDGGVIGDYATAEVYRNGRLVSD